LSAGAHWRETRNTEAFFEVWSVLAGKSFEQNNSQKGYFAKNINFYAGQARPLTAALFGSDRPMGKPWNPASTACTVCTAGGVGTAGVGRICGGVQATRARAA